MNQRMASMPAGRPLRLLAWGLWGLVMALCAVGYVLLFLTRDVPVGDVYGLRGVTGLLAIPFATMGLLLAARRGRNPIGWLFLAAGVMMGFGLFAENYATYSFALRDSTLPLTDPIGWIQNWVWLPLVAFGLVYPFLLFPDGRLPSRRWRWLAWFAPAPVAAFALVIAVAPGQLQTVADGFLNPYAVGEETAETLVSILGLPFLAVVALSVIAMAGRFRRSIGDEHEQMKWLLFAGSLTAVCLLMNVVAGIAGPEGLAWRAVAFLTQASIAGIPVAAAVAVLRYRLYDIEVIINQAVVFSLVAAFITVAYVGTIVGIGAVVETWGGSNVVLPIVATAFVAIAFQPVRRRAHELANRFVYGKRTTPYEALAALADARSIEDLLPRVARLATESSAARRSIVWLSTGVELRPIASWPEGDSMPSPVPLREGSPDSPPTGAHMYSLIHQGELLGAITIRMGPGEVLPSADNRLLSDLAAHAAIALRGVLEAVELPSGLVTFLMTDVEGSTRLWEEEAEAMGAAMREHDALVRELVRAHQGILIKWRGEGDSTFSVFTSAGNAAAAAGAIQGEVAAHRWPTSRPLAVRAAVHTGEAELRARDYFGQTVNRCARLRGLARGGQTVVSAATRELIRDHLPGDLILEDLGEHQLKDVVGTDRVYELRRVDLLGKPSSPVSASQMRSSEAQAQEATSSGSSPSR
jgi:class 3 adenylate cyclase